MTVQKMNTAGRCAGSWISNSSFKLIDRKENKGKGYTVRQGILEAKGKIRLFTDADNSTDISYFEKMRPFFDKGYDIVISSRDSKDAARSKSGNFSAVAQEIDGQYGQSLYSNYGSSGNLGHSKRF